MVQFPVENINGKLPEKVKVDEPPAVAGLDSTKALVEVMDATVVLVGMLIPFTAKPTWVLAIIAGFTEVAL